VPVALDTQQANRMRRIILSSVACLVLTNFSTLSTFSKKDTEHKICVLIFSKILSEIFLILKKIQRDFNINVYEFSCKVPVIVVIF
jgi:hypothetical protein